MPEPRHTPQRKVRAQLLRHRRAFFQAVHDQLLLVRLERGIDREQLRAWRRCRHDRRVEEGRQLVGEWSRLDRTYNSLPSRTRRLLNELREDTPAEDRGNPVRFTRAEQDYLGQLREEFAEEL